MAGYGYIYRSSSTYNTVRDIEPRGPVIKPFVPFVPNTNSNSESHVTKKTIVPVSSRPYSDDYHARGDDYGSPRKVDEFLTKVQNEASRPARFTPVSSTDWRQSPQPTYNNSAIGYGDYGSNKEGGHKPIGSTIRNDNYDGYNGPNGYGGHGNYDNKEGRKPIGGTIRKDNYDGYSSPNGYGDYNNKEGYKSNGSAIRNDNYDGYNGTKNNNGYGGYGDKDRYRPFGSTTRNDNYDGYHGGNGYGDYRNYSNKEGYKPSGSNSILNDNYDRRHPAEKPNKIIPGGWTRPIISSAWTAPPRKGTQLSEPTNDIDKAVELLKEVAKLNDHSNKGEHKSGGTALPYDNNYDDYQRRHDEPTSKFSKGVELAKEAERLKNILTGTPQSRSSVSIEPSNKDYGDATRRDDARRYGNEPIIDSWEAEKKFKGRRV